MLPTSEFERAFRHMASSDAAGIYADVEASVTSAAERGMIYCNRAFPVLPCIDVRSASSRDHFAEIAEGLLRILDKVGRLYHRDETVRDFFMLSPRAADLTEIDAGYRRSIWISRFDSYLTDGGTSFKILENNTDCPAGVVFTGRVNHLLGGVRALRECLAGGERVRSEAIDTPDAFIDALLGAHAEFSGRSTPPRGIGILQVRGQASPETQQMVRLFRQRGLSATVGDPRDAKIVDGTMQIDSQSVDLVWNKINTAYFVPLLDDIDALSPYLEACRERIVCQVNSFTARFVTESKLCLALLSDPRFRHHFDEREQALLDAHIPWSRRLEGDPVVEFEGRRASLRTLARESRADLVLKAAYDIRGDGVTIGRSVSKQEWLAVLDDAWDGPFILQEFIPPPQREVVRADASGGFDSRNFSMDMFMLAGRFAGFGSKVSSELKVNVFQAGSKQAMLSYEPEGHYTYWAFRSFTVGAEGGNPARVVVGAGLGEAEMRAIAAQADGIVTVFEIRSGEMDWHLRFFNGDAELPLCAHGLLAGSFALARRTGMTQLSFETKAGPVMSTVDDEGLVSIACAEASSGRSYAAADVAPLLGLAPDAIRAGPPPVVVSVGSPKLMVGVDVLEHLTTLEPRTEPIARWSEREEVNGIYAYWRDDDEPTRIVARSFNPRFGVIEDAATGVAAAALGGLLGGTSGGHERFRIEQGANLGRASELHVAVDGTRIRLCGRVAWDGLGRGRIGGRP